MWCVGVHWHARSSQLSCLALLLRDGVKGVQVKGAVGLLFFWYAYCVYHVAQILFEGHLTPASRTSIYITADSVMVECTINHGSQYKGCLQPNRILIVSTLIIQLRPLT